MDITRLSGFYRKTKYEEDIFHNLMQKRVREVLLVSTFYDAFIFEQDGRLSEQIHGEYRQLNLSTAPRITSVPTGEQALEKLETKRYDLVITMMRIGEINPFELSRRVKEKYPELPVLLLLNVRSDLVIIDRDPEMTTYIDDIFLWNGDTKLFLAMIKSVEDRLNVADDTGRGLIRVILMVEDSIQYYSMFLPLLYSVTMRQTQRLISQELIDISKRMRMRARPKVLLVHTYEDAERLVEEYREFLIAVISDISYPRNGEMFKDAGFHLANKIRSLPGDVPVILQSSEEVNREKAEEQGASFLHKDLQHLLHDLQQIVIRDLGFGDFIFRDEYGREYDRAVNIYQFEKKLETVPDSSIIFHSEQNHFSAWLIAHGDILVASQIRPLRVDDFTSADVLREFLLNAFNDVRRQRTRGKILNFDPDRLLDADQLIRLSEGSLGGKGRGLAFFNSLLVAMEFEKTYPGVRIGIPPTLVIGTETYETVMNNLGVVVESGELSDAEIVDIFRRQTLPAEVLKRLEMYLEKMHQPLAVRSSGLLEDSQAGSIAGMYKTVFLPNGDTDILRRLQDLQQAVLDVYASTHSGSVRDFMHRVRLNPEEEKMAVLVQPVSGSRRSIEDRTRYYPHLSGIARSRNLVSDFTLRAGESWAGVGFGLSAGQAGIAFRFQPHNPPRDPDENLLHFVERFFAIDQDRDKRDCLVEVPLNQYWNDPALPGQEQVAVMQKDMLPEEHRERFAAFFRHLLVNRYVPLPEILNSLCEIGENSMGAPVELEFSLDLEQDISRLIYPTLHIHQIRPLTNQDYKQLIDIDSIDWNQTFVHSRQGIGHGRIRGIHDLVVYVGEEMISPGMLREEIRNIDRKLEGHAYIFVGDPCWNTKNGTFEYSHLTSARIIVERSSEKRPMEQYLSTHMVHILTSLQIAYILLDNQSRDDYFDWNWMMEQDIELRDGHFIHIRFENEIPVIMDGREGRYLIEKTE